MAIVYCIYGYLFLNWHVMSHYYYFLPSQFQLTQSKGEVIKIKEKIRSLEQKELQHKQEIIELQLKLDEKENEKKRLQKQHEVAGSSLVGECKEDYVQLMQLLGDTAKLRQDIIEREVEKFHKKTELAIFAKEMELLKHKLVRFIL